jgi:hypothetical protein
MRGGVAITVTVIVALGIVALYFFLGRAQIIKSIQEVEGQSAALSQQLVDIDKKREELPEMLKQLPTWREELAIYKRAVPAEVDDDEFLVALAEQLDVNDVQLLSVELLPAGKWLGEIGEAQAEELEQAGIDVDAARQVRAAHYSINLIGEFEGVLTAFENLKGYQRLYTIDQVTGPAGRGSGSVSEQVDPNTTPIQITGRIYYGLPDSYLSDAELVRVFATAVITPRAREVGEYLSGRGRRLVTGDDAADTNGEESVEPPASAEETEEVGPAAGSGTAPDGADNGGQTLDAAAVSSGADDDQHPAAEVATT